MTQPIGRRKKKKNMYFDNARWARLATLYRESWLLDCPDIDVRDEIARACMVVIDRMIYSNHFAKLYGREYMEDMRQECYMKLIRDLHQFKEGLSKIPEYSLFSFVSRICKNHLLSWEQKLKRRRANEVLTDNLESSLTRDQETTHRIPHRSALRSHPDWADPDEHPPEPMMPADEPGQFD